MKLFFNRAGFRGWLFAGLLAGASLSANELRVLPEEAIPFSAFLEKAAFDSRFPGTLVSDPGKLDAGWYVTYEHEALRYYFGPILLESTGRDYKARLETIVAEAVAARPSITGYEIALRYEPSAPVSSGSQAENEAAEAPPIPSLPPERFSFFRFIRKVFGF